MEMRGGRQGERERDCQSSICCFTPKTRQLSLGRAEARSLAFSGFDLTGVIGLFCNCLLRYMHADRTVVSQA